MCNDRKLFQHFEDTSSEILIAKKNQSMKAEGVGVIESSNCVLNKVLYIPELSKNLLSVSAITEREAEVTFTKEKVIITKNNVKVLEGEKLKSGLYAINLENKGETSLMTERINKVQKWHKKLGHLGSANMKKLIDLSTGIDINKQDCDQQDVFVKHVFKQNKAGYLSKKKGAEHLDHWKLSILTYVDQ